MRIQSILAAFMVALTLFTACTKQTLRVPLSPATSISSPTRPPLCQSSTDGSKISIRVLLSITTASPVVLLLDFNGQYVNNTIWNTDGPFTSAAVPSSLMSASMRESILQTIIEDFRGFEVKVTTSEAEYQSAPADRRTRCIITHNMGTRLGEPAGGRAYIGSMLWGDNTPCFIFCDVLQYNEKYISGAISHELGHTFGLQHQSSYDSEGQLSQEYHEGLGYGTLGWTPIMGLTYYQSIVTWHKGTSVLGPDQIQDDMQIIGTVAGITTDDYSDANNSSTIILPATGNKSGTLENANDKDAFMKNDTQSKRIKLTSKGNSDLALEVYSTNGQLQSVYDDAEGKDVNVIITGKKYFRVKISSAQPFVPVGDGFGGYTINVSKL